MTFKEELEAGALPRPYFVWEPMEHSCSPENLDSFLRALACVNTFSPNESEFAELCNMPLEPPGATLTLEMIEVLCQEFLGRCQSGHLEAIVVRLGAKGALVAQKENQKNQWLPAYHGSGPDDTIPSKVTDVTGGGNAFMGGFCAGLIQTHQVAGCTRHEGAAIFGSVAASFAIEQIGMPKIDVTADNIGGLAYARLDEYLRKVEALT